MNTDFEAALKLPFSSWKKLLIGAGFFVLVFLLALIPVAGLNSLLTLLVSAIPIGYALLCARSAAQKRFVLPEWTNFKELFIKGIAALAISIIYFIPVFILFVVFVLLVVGALGSSTALMMQENPGFVFQALSGLSGAIAVAVIAVLLLLLVYYLLPMAWMKMINEGFGAAFDFKDIFRRAFTVKYFLGVLFAYTLNCLIMLAGMCVALLVILTLVGPFVAYSLAAMVSYVVTMAIYGQLYAETTARKVVAVKAARKK